MSGGYDMDFWRIDRRVDSYRDLRDEDIVPVGTPDEIRALFEKALDGDVYWGHRDAHGPLMQWRLSLNDAGQVLWATMAVGYRTAEERLALTRRVCDATGWTALDPHNHGVPQALHPRTITDRSYKP